VSAVLRDRHLKSAASLLPRLIRLRDAAYYLGMDKNRFNREVRPHVTEVRIGIQGIGFDRLELDRFADQYVARNGRPAAGGKEPWDESAFQVSSVAVKSGTSTNASEVDDFRKALAKATSRRLKPT
jgi:hypothetical protein